MAEVGNFIIPQFKDKTIYWTSGNTQISYPINRSFRGILRLSPNDDRSLLEKSNVKISEDNDTLGIYYKDSIENELNSQLIRTSTSDGYFVDWRLSRYQVEFNNLFVIGPAFQSQLRVYTKTEQGIVMDGKNYLPAKANPHIQAQAEGTTDSISKDVIPTNLTDKGDLTYLLVNSQIKDKRIFEYKQVRSIIEEIIVESMLDLCTTPTGSIHYTPINIEQYNKLLKTGHPNKAKNIANTDNNISIIRDYLVCDGSLYYNKDFPELAKVLKGEKIIYWEYDEASKAMIKKTHINDYGQDDEDDKKVFRVPDLRRMFLKSSYIPTNRDELDNPWCETGNWMNDTRPQFENNKSYDSHRHFITSAHYQDYPNLSAFSQVAYKDAETGRWGIGTSVTDKNPKPGVLAPKNNMAMWRRCGYGTWYDIDRYGDDAATGYRVPGNTCGYFLSIPQEFDYQNPANYNANIVLSSEDFSSCLQNPTSDNDIDYNNHSEYVNFSQGSAASSYGMENTPEYYAMLPLIKI